MYFRMSIVTALMGSYEHTTTSTRPRHMDNPQRLEETGHFIELSQTRGDCVVCTLHQADRSLPGAQYKNRRQIKYKCKTCLPKIPLCVVPCFEIYHTKVNPKDYWYRSIWLPSQQ
jgi:hypothetical protein